MFTFAGRAMMQRMDFFVNNINQVMMDRVAEYAEDTIPSMVAGRITSRGKSSTGGNFTGYSKDWAKKRRKHGLQTGFKDFRFSGEMWNSMKVLNKEMRSTEIVITLGMSGINTEPYRSSYARPGGPKANAEIARHHGDREGESIIFLNRDEFSRVKSRVSEILIEELTRTI